MTTWWPCTASIPADDSTFEDVFYGSKDDGKDPHPLVPEVLLFQGSLVPRQVQPKQGLRTRIKQFILSLVRHFPLFYLVWRPLGKCVLELFLSDR